MDEWRCHSRYIALQHRFELLRSKSHLGVVRRSAYFVMNYDDSLQVSHLILIDFQQESRVICPTEFAGSPIQSQLKMNQMILLNDYDIRIRRSANSNLDIKAPFSIKNQVGL